ncbi:MAG TPA: hypothetical protein VFL55_13695 [Acetobacteraceae bacterium]|nr:hypothetical protein [Acetobacteraceae bacterium]
MAKPRLRFDKVAVRLVRRLQEAVGGAVPDGCTVVLTITAPIRLPGKTTVALEALARSNLKAAQAAVEVVVHGNRVRLRLVEHAVPQAAKVIGIVHNADTDPDLLLGVTRSLLDGIGTRAASATAGERRLVIASGVEPSLVEAYRYAWNELAIPTRHAKVVLVLADGRVEVLKE